MVNVAPSMSGIIDSHACLPSRRPGTTPERKNSRNGGMRASAGGITALGGFLSPTKVPGKSTNPCTQSSFVAHNVFNVIQDLSESIGGSTRPQLDAADGLLEVGR